MSHFTVITCTNRKTGVQLVYGFAMPAYAARAYETEAGKVNTFFHNRSGPLHNLTPSTVFTEEAADELPADVIAIENMDAFFAEIGFDYETKSFA